MQAEVAESVIEQPVGVVVPATVVQQTTVPMDTVAQEAIHIMTPEEVETEKKEAARLAKNEKRRLARAAAKQVEEVPAT